MPSATEPSGSVHENIAPGDILEINSTVDYCESIDSTQANFTSGWYRGVASDLVESAKV